MKNKRFFKFEIIITVLFISFRFIWINLLWAYGHFKIWYSYGVANITDA